MQLAFPQVKAAIPLSYADLKLLKMSFRKVPRILKEHLIAPPEGICVYRNNFASHLNTKVMNALITAGIPQYWYKFVVEFELRSPPEPPRMPKVFSIDDLKYGFIIWLVAISVSVAAFLLEFSTFYAAKLFIYMVENIAGFCGLRLTLMFYINIQKFN